MTCSQAELLFDFSNDIGMQALGVTILAGWPTIRHIALSASNARDDTDILAFELSEHSLYRSAGCNLDNDEVDQHDSEQHWYDK